jgi:hypothetical protein
MLVSAMRVAIILGVIDVTNACNYYSEWVKLCPGTTIVYPLLTL